MEDKQFDQHIKNKLEQFRVESSDLHWSQMEQRLDLEFGEMMHIEKQVKFDTEIQQKLHAHQVSFNPLHWNILKARLDFEDDRVRQVYASKAFEIAFFLLGLLFFLQVNPSQRQNYQRALAEDELNQEMAYYNSEDQQTNNKLQKADTEDAHINQFAIVSQEDRGVQEMNSFLSNNNTEEAYVLDQSQTNQEKQDIVQSSINLLTPIEKLSIAPITTQSTSALSIIYTSNELENRAYTMPAQYISALDLSPLHLIDDKIIIPLHAQASTGIKAKWLNLIASRDANLLNESVFAVLDPDSLIGSYGLSLGLAYSVQNNRFEFETGLTYSNKKIPINQSQITGDTRAYIRSSVINSQLHMAQIPILLKYHINPKNRVGLYTGTGINVNLLMHSKELVKDQNLDFAKPSAFIAVPASNLSFVEEHSTKGLIEGGNLSDNTYISLNFVIGLQVQLTEGISTFIQPSYQHHIFSNAFGFNQDKIHVLSLQLGSKIKF